MTFMRIIGITVATAVIVFLGLTFLLPRHHEEKAQVTGVSPEQVFDASATPPPAGETPAAPAPSATDSASAPAATDAPAPASPTAATTAAASSSPAPAEQGLTDEEARKIAEDVARKVATRVVEEKSAPAAPSEPAAAEPAAPEPSAPPATPADTAAQDPTAAPPSPKKSKPKPAAKAAETASSKPAAAPARPVKSKAVKAKDMPGGKAASDAISGWWPAADKQQADRLNLVYAGEAAFEKAVVLLFNNPVDASAASSNLELFDATGKTVSGSWSSGSNPRMLMFKDLKPGRYTVVLKPELADSSGKVLPSGLHGPVYVH